MPAKSNKPTEARELPQFARPVGVSPFPFESTKRGRPSTAYLFLLTTLTGTPLLVLARADKAQNLPVSTKKATAAHAAQTSDATTPNGPAVESDVDNALTRRPLTFYTEAVRGSMFSPPQPPKPVEKPAPKPPPAPVVPVMPINPFANWTYTGTVHVGDQIMALIENSQTKEGQYVKVGDNFMGASVSAITDQMVTLMASGKPNMLAKSDNITLTPLDKNADFMNAQTQQQPGQPGMPGMPNMPQQGMPGMQMNMTPNAQGMITLPNGRMISADRAARRNRFLNRRFNQ